jgi:KUP system potassium uptake protein
VVDHLGDPTDGIVHIAADFGFRDRPDFPEALRRAAATEPEALEAALRPEGVWYFVSAPFLVARPRSGPRGWPVALFIGLARRGGDPAESLDLPPDRTVALGIRIEL